MISKKMQTCRIDSDSMIIQNKYFNIALLTLILIVSGILILKSSYFYSNHPDIVWFFVYESVALLITIYLTDIFRPKFYQKKIKYVLAPYFKAAIIIITLTWIGTNLIFHSIENISVYFHLSLVASISIIVVYTILTAIFNSWFYNDEVIKHKVSKYAQHDLSLDQKIGINIKFFNQIMDSEYFSPKILNEIVSKMDIDSDDTAEISRVLSIDSVDSEIKDNFILDRRLNDFKDLNEVLGKLYASLAVGGWLIAVYKDLQEFEDELYGNRKGIIKFFKKTVYYFYYRGIPKIPIFNIVYQVLSRGKNKVYSRAEIWGRLCYCGFDVKEQVSHNGLSYLIARKQLSVSTNPNPSFYPVITLNRVGLFGQIIKIHKVRSMYPYSEFIQKKVHDENQLTSTGKFGNDFRITEFGRIYRKYWIDELPQLLDWFRGEIKLVGIRALSQHYYSLYPPEFQAKFIQVKPGIISPIFDEATDGFDDIVRIETAYLDSYLTNPVFTDIKYFFVTLKQILSGVRSK